MSPVSVAVEYLGESGQYFALFGVAVAAWVTSKLLCSLWSGLKTYFLARRLGLAANVREFGAWAVVTGSTDGIGKAYAQQLAKRGMNIVLISRNPDRLRNTAQEIESQYKVETKVVAVDFTHGPDIYDTIEKGIDGLEVGVLVNNVGMSQEFPEYFCDIENQKKRILDLVRINIDTVNMMTRLVLPGMVERKTGAIINIASGAGVAPTPFLTVYSASKAYVDFFSQALQEEYRSKGIIVQSVIPFFVTTKLSKIRRASFMVPTPDNYVRSALATLGVQSRTFGCVAHAMQGWVVSVVPYWLYLKKTVPELLFARNWAHQKRQKKIS